MHLLDGLYPSCDLDQVGKHSSSARVALSYVQYCTTFSTRNSFAGFLLLTWEFASLDGYAVCGEVLGEVLRLCGLA